MTCHSSGRPTRFLAVASLVAMLALPVLGSGSALATTLPTGCALASSTVTCTYTSGDNVFTVPADVATIHVVAVGGHGSATSGAVGGAGAQVSADLDVSGGADLHAVVGGNAVGAVGGANGGGDGGSLVCGGGGGASDVRTSAAVDDRILVAAGGGGAGCLGRVSGTASGSAGSGGDAASPGGDGVTLLDTVNYAAFGGEAGCATALSTTCGRGGQGSVSGGDGSFGTGGAGGAASSVGHQGGGGGGGLYGGGGGGTGWASVTCTFLGCVSWVDGAGGGGGGGSNLVPSGGSASTDATGVPEVEISYAAFPPVADVSPSSLGFGSVPVGVLSSSQLVTVTNSAAAGAASLHIGFLAFALGAADFRLVSDPCSNATLVPSASCSVVVAFEPTALGTRSGILRIPDDASGSPQDVQLSGTGVTPIASVSPSSIDFGTLAVGATSGHRTVTVTNVGNADDLLFTSETITGANASDFGFAGDTCITNFIAAGASCTIDLTFTPGATGARSATLTISDNGLGSPHTVALTGTGGTPSADLAVSISGSPNPVKTGQRVTYTITVFNAGPSSATSILVNDSLSSQSTFVSATISQGSCITPVRGASGVISCSFASLASGSSQPIQIVVTVIAKKNTITNTVSVSAATPDPNLVNNTASITTRVK